MKYVIIRDDDTCALTPVECLERLYRPFLERGLPVNLATIPNVRSDVFLPSGEPEGFLVASKGVRPGFYSLAGNRKLVEYLKGNPLYHIVQHGCHHEFVRGFCEFDHDDLPDLIRRLDQGRAWLHEAGFPDLETFVAPYDRITRAGYPEVARRFKIISTGWFESGRIPYAWWPKLAWRKLKRTHHWRAGGVTLLSHPGCHLSYHRPPHTILPRIKASIEERRVTVLVTHWWEFFRGNTPDQPFIDVLHETAAYLSSRSDLRVISFRQLLEEDLTLD